MDVFVFLLLLRGAAALRPAANDSDCAVVRATLRAAEMDRAASLVPDTPTADDHGLCGSGCCDSNVTASFPDEAGRELSERLAGLNSQLLRYLRQQEERLKSSLGSLLAFASSELRGRLSLAFPLLGSLPETTGAADALFDRLSRLLLHEPVPARPEDTAKKVRSAFSAFTSSLFVPAFACVATSASVGACREGVALRLPSEYKDCLKHNADDFPLLKGTRQLGDELATGVVRLRAGLETLQLLRGVVTNVSAPTWSPACLDGFSRLRFCPACAPSEATDGICSGACLASLELCLGGKLPRAWGGLLAAAHGFAAKAGRLGVRGVGGVAFSSSVESVVEELGDALVGSLMGALEDGETPLAVARGVLDRCGPAPTLVLRAQTTTHRSRRSVIPTSRAPLRFQSAWSILEETLGTLRQSYTKWWERSATLLCQGTAHVDCWDGTQRLL